MYRIVLPVIGAKGMPGSDKIKCETILGGYEEIDEEGNDCLRGKKTANYGSNCRPSRVCV
jgi:hypothetical protein